MPPIVATVTLLIISNAFMLFAWYGHLKNFNSSPLWQLIILSWAVALLEYIFLIPANKIGYQSGMLTLAQLKIIQEVVTLLVFIPFALYYMRHPLSWNYLWALLCLVGAVYFIFK